MPTTTVPGEKLGAIAAALRTALNGVEDMQLLEYDPVAGVEASMVLGVGDVEGSSTRVGERGTQLASRDWDQRWTVHFYIWLDDGGAAIAWAKARKAMGQALNSLDTDPRLGGEVREVVIADWSIRPSLPDEGRRMLVGELLVEVKTLMDDPYQP